MAENTSIPWTTHTFNGWEGCTKVSPGCVHCYAENRNKRFAGGANWGPGAPRRRTSHGNWLKPLRWNREAEGFPWSPIDGPYSKANRPRVFCASLADWLDDEVPIEWLADLLDLIRRTPNLDWLLLTKRPQNFMRRMAGVFRVAGTNNALALMAHGWACNQAPPNVWIGTTVEDQTRADERIPLLLSIPAKVRFLSCEPLLGKINLVSRSTQRGPHFKTITGTGWLGGGDDPSPIHWGIIGCESGPGRREMQIEWATFLVEQFKFTGVAPFMKQMVVHGKVTEDIAVFPEHLRVREFPTFPADAQ